MLGQRRGMRDYRKYPVAIAIDIDVIVPSF
jgi:hypothetical protein